MPSLLQVVAALPPETRSLYESAGIVLIVGVGKLFDHWKGRKRDASNKKQLDRIEGKVDNFHGRVVKIEHEMWGATGENGMRSRVVGLESNMDELKRRGHFNTPPEFPAPGHSTRYRP